LLDNDETLWNTDPEENDSDGDGFPDGYEVLVAPTRPCTTRAFPTRARRT
jgi:hypothetical protein